MRLLSRRLILALAAALTAAPALAAAPAKFTAPEYVMGNPRAPVTVVEYASVTCPHCARFDLQVFPEFRKKYVDTGKVRYVFREFLTPPVEVAAAGFVLARCAGSDKYFSVVDDLFHRQEKMYETNDVKGTLLAAARDAGLDEAQTDACLTNQQDLQAVNDRTERANKVEKVDGTPTFFINGKMFQGEPGKEVDLAQLDRAIQPLLDRPAAHRPTAQRR